MEDPFRDLTDAELSALELIETFRFDPAEGFVRLDRHLARMARSARVLGLPFRLEAAQAALSGIGGDQPLRVRLSMRSDGVFACSTAPLAPNPPFWTIRIAEARLSSTDPWLRHKTNRRALYDAARAALPEGVDELVFLNERGALCEGTITNLFIEKDGRLLTPPISCGLLPGVLREELLATGKAEEAELFPEDLRTAEAVYCGNSLRGLIPARLGK